MRKYLLNSSSSSWSSFLSFPIVFIVIFGFTLTLDLAHADQGDFQKGLDYAKSKSAQDKIQEALSGFKPQEVFKSQKGGYTEDPPQADHYKGETQSNTIELAKAAQEEIAKNEDYKDKDGNFVPTPGKAITEDFKSRKVFKIGQKEDFMQKGKLVTENANNIVMGESNKHINCEAKKMSACKIVQVEKTCNEEVRAIRRICEKVPSITTHVNEIVYPNCQVLDIKQHVNTRCSSGYTQILESDMVHTRHDHWDDIRFCTKLVPVGEPAECYSGGYYIATSHRGYFGSERAIVPKKLHARIKISNVYDGFVVGTIFNETTGQPVRNNESFSGGQVIELPYSETQDQTFLFYAIGQRGRYGQRIGVMVLYVDKINKERVADVPVWQESCRDV